MTNIDEIRKAIREEIQSWYDTYGECIHSIEIDMPDGTVVWSDDVTYYVGEVLVSNILLCTEEDEENIGDITVPFEEAQPVDDGDYSCREEYKYYQPFAV